MHSKDEPTKPALPTEVPEGEIADEQLKNIAGAGYGLGGRSATGNPKDERP